MLNKKFHSNSLQTYIVRRLPIFERYKCDRIGLLLKGCLYLNDIKCVRIGLLLKGVGDKFSFRPNN